MLAATIEAQESMYQTINRFPYDLIMNSCLIGVCIMSEKKSPVTKLKDAVRKAAVGSMDPLVNLLAIALDNDTISEELDQRLKGKMIGSARMLSLEGDLQSGIRGTIEIPFYSSDVAELLNEPVFIFVDLATKQSYLVSRPVPDQSDQPRVESSPFVMASRKNQDMNVVSLGPEAVARENAYFGRIGLSPRTPFTPNTLPQVPGLETLINEIINRRDWMPRGAAASQTTCTYDTSSTCVVFTAPGMNYDQRVQDDCEGDGFKTDD
jgi:hypothetical protein